MRVAGLLSQLWKRRMKGLHGGSQLCEVHSMRNTLDYLSLEMMVAARGTALAQAHETPDAEGLVHELSAVVDEIYRHGRFSRTRENIAPAEHVRS